MTYTLNGAPDFVELVEPEDATTPYLKIYSSTRADVTDYDPFCVKITYPGNNQDPLSVNFFVNMIDPCISTEIS